MRVRGASLIFAGYAAFLLSACGGNYVSRTASAREAFERRDFQAADADYKSGAEEDGKDQLLYLFDRGTVRHTAGRYEDSVKDLLLADKLSEIKDYTSLATEAATIITNDRITQYKGEEFETVLVSVLLAVDYALAGNKEDALVECRRVNRKLERMRSEGSRDYELNAFAQYLSGLLYEKDHDWNNALVDYRKTHSILSAPELLRKDLLRGLVKLGSDSQFDLWRRKIHYTDDELKDARDSLKHTGSVVLLYENGFAPEKVVSDAWPELPAYRTRYNRHRAAVLYLDGVRAARSELFFDVEKAALKNFEQKYAVYIAKRLAGIAAREVIGDQVEKHTKSAELGTLVKVALFIASQPDLRAWLTLPKDFQVARAFMPPGRYHAELRLENMQGAEEAPKDLGMVEIRKPGDVVLLNWRSLND